MTLFSPSQESSFVVEEEEDEENSFLPCISGNFIEEDEEEDGEEDKEKEEGMDESLSYLMTCLLQRPPNIDHNKCQEYNFIANAVDKVLHGEFIEVITSSPLQLLSFFHSSSGSLKLTEDIANCVRDFLVNDNFEELKTVEERILHCLVLGFASLQIYCQANYTGPELSSTAIQSITLHRLGGHETSPGENDGEDEIVSQRLFESALQALECDGNYCFRSCLLPHCLLIARVILSYLEAPSLASWRAGIYLDSDGEIKRYSSSIPPLPKHIAAKLSVFPMRGWLSARAAVIHRRLLQAKSFEHVPSLWNETESAFSYTESHLTPPNSDVTNEKGVNPLLGLFYLERGMATHFFEHSDRGKVCFQLAKECIGLHAELSAALGKRTKHQIQDFAQLHLFTVSSLATDGLYTEEAAATSAAPISQQSLKFSSTSSQGENEHNPEGWQHSEWEVGRRLVRETAQGEEAALREILLDDTDGGAQENILFEHGPKFKDSGLRSSALHPLDDCTILALCLDVENSNPKDGLTTEEMFPYIERVLVQVKNWMVHSTALLQRSWLEFDKRRTMDRALLQIQALLDQHTTKLTMFQSSYQCIEESASADERLRYFHGLSYPSQYELKRDLAERYLKCGIFQSALAYFRELELWDEVVTCYQLLDKPHRAELVVRERLKLGESPYMLTALGDITGEAVYYEQAWSLSKGRYARAKRTLGRMAFDKQLYAECIDHLNAALAVQPLVAHAWYTKGVACMRLERWGEAVMSFTRCVQQDMEIGEAHANIGAVHMKLNNMGKAYTSFYEALKHKPDSWMLLENLLTVCLSLGRFREAVAHMNSLLDLRHKSNRPVHIDELRKLSAFVASQTWKLVHEQRRMAARDTNTELDLNAEVKDEEMPPLTLEVDRLIGKVTNAIKSNADVWDILAEFHASLGRKRSALESRYKEIRALTVDPAWAKELESVTRVLTGVEKLLDAHLSFEDVTKNDWYACASLMRRVEAQMSALFGASDAHEKLLGFIRIVADESNLQ